MKLYTTPRPLHPYQLQPGDQIATFRRGGALIGTTVAYVDADLLDEVAWSVVHGTSDAEQAEGKRSERLTIRHTLGEHDKDSGSTVIVREVIEVHEG